MRRLNWIALGEVKLDCFVLGCTKDNILVSE
jgi:hypothetical protein